jgi:F-type H+-transporting ATPase subunit b
MTINWWTLGIQAVNVVILIWLLGRFFWRPVAAMIAQRRAAAQQLLSDAEAKRAEASAGLAEVERTRAGFAGERAAILDEARKAADGAREARLAEAEKEAEALRDAAQAAIAKDKQTADEAAAERAARLAVDIARRLAGRLDGPAVRAAFLDWLLAEIRALPEATRIAAAAGPGLEAISAAPLELAEQQRYAKAIKEALGAEATIAFRADAALIAGLELRGAHLVVANSWRADLASILADLAHVDRA